MNLVQSLRCPVAFSSPLSPDHHLESLDVPMLRQLNRYAGPRNPTSRSVQPELGLAWGTMQRRQATPWPSFIAAVLPAPQHFLQKAYSEALSEVRQKLHTRD